MWILYIIGALTSICFISYFAWDNENNYNGWMGFLKQFKWFDSIHEFFQFLIKFWTTAIIACGGFYCLIKLLWSCLSS